MHTEKMQESVRPSVVKVLFDNVPSQLVALDRWVVWKLEWDGKKWTKRPYRALNPAIPASATDPITWSSFADAAIACKTRDDIAGIGIAVPEGMVGIDLDHCRDPESGELKQWATEFLEQFPSYAEVSPSGTGLRIMIYGELPEYITKQKKSGKKYDIDSATGERIEVYGGARYLTITGHKLKQSPIRNCQDALDLLFAEYWPEPEESPERPARAYSEGLETRLLKQLSDPEQELLKRKFQQCRQEWDAKAQGLIADRSKVEFELLSYLKSQDIDPADAWENLQDYGKFRQRGYDYFYSTWQNADIRDYGDELTQIGIEQFDFQQPTESEGYKFLLMSEVFDAAEDQFEWYVEGWLPRGSLKLISGSGKDGKTTLIASTVTDIIFDQVTLLGQETIKTPVLWLDFDGNPKSYPLRLFKHAVDTRGRDCFDGVLNFASHLYGDSQSPSGLPEYLTVDSLKRLCHGREPGLIVIDSLRPAFMNNPGLEPNWDHQAHTVGKLLRPFVEFCHSSKWTMIFIHHDNRSGGYGGSNEFLNAVDSIDHFERVSGEYGDTRRKLSTKGREIEEQTYLLNYVDGRYQAFESSNSPFITKGELIKLIPVVMGDQEFKQKDQIQAALKQYVKDNGGQVKQKLLRIVVDEAASEGTISKKSPYKYEGK